MFVDVNKFKKLRREKLTRKDKLKTRVLRTPLHHAAVIVKGIVKGKDDDEPPENIDQLSQITTSHERSDCKTKRKGYL